MTIGTKKNNPIKPNLAENDSLPIVRDNDIVYTPQKRDVRQNSCVRSRPATRPSFNRPGTNMPGCVRLAGQAGDYGTGDIQFRRIICGCRDKIMRQRRCKQPARPGKTRYHAGMTINLPALGALLLFALSFLSAADGLGIDRLCGGYLRQYRLHHRLAWLAGLAVLTHGLTEWLSLPVDDRAMLLDWHDRSLPPAWLAALALPPLLLAASRYPHWRRRYWLRIHWLLLAAFVLALAHAWLAARPAHRVWLPWLALAPLPWLLRYLPPGLWPRFSGRRYRARLLHPSDRTTLLELDASTLPHTPCAGQIVQVRLLGLPSISHQWHPFSVASCRCEPVLRLLIRQAGLDTVALGQAGPQIDIALRGPYHEWLARFDAPQVWLAGGVGIAPFIGLWHCRQSGQPAPLAILHFTTGLDTLDYLPLLGSCNGPPPYTRLSQDGLPDWQALAPLTGLARVRFLVSGPPGFVKAACRHLRTAGVPRHRIDAERLPG